MAKASDEFLRLQSGYLFPEVARRIRAWQERHVGDKVLKLSIGNTTEALPPIVAKAMEEKVHLLTDRNTYTGYGDEQGDTPLREALCNMYKREHGVSLPLSAFFISDGAKSDAANIQSIFSRSSIPAIQDPSYPVYVDSCVASGLAGSWDDKNGGYSGIVYMKAGKDTGFIPEPPKEHADLIYICFPNNPTGAVATRDQLEGFVRYALDNESILIFDSAYTDYIERPEIPHSIYEIPGAEECAIEIGSFSKNTGFTGVRLGWSIVPETLRANGVQDGTLHRLWNRRQCTFFNGASNVAQAGGIAALSEAGRAECMSLVGYYKENARIIKEGVEAVGLKAYGGVDSPYIWTECPDGMTSWEFFDYLLEKAHVAVTPGSGFGPMGEGYVRISAYGHREDVVEAVKSIKERMASRT